MTRFTAIYGTKGGVGKSTLAVNIAYALRSMSESVGLVDLDLSGPNIQTLVAAGMGRDPYMDNFRVMPGEYSGVGVSGLGFFVQPDQAGLLSGRYLEGALRQLLFHDAWQAYEHVVLDMPPGFSELHRLVYSRLRVRTILVTTPHVLSVDDLARGQTLLRQLHLPILGYVENMSHFHCPACGHVSHLFGRQESNRLEDLQLLASIPFVADTTPEREYARALFGPGPVTTEFQHSIQRIAHHIHETS